jgi:hypothetical protein
MSIDLPGSQQKSYDTILERCKIKSLEPPVRAEPKGSSSLKILKGYGVKFSIFFSLLSQVIVSFWLA